MYSIRKEGEVSHSGATSSKYVLLKVCSKIVSTIVSTFTAYYIHLWSTYFPDTPLSPPLPSFDGRAVCYPSVQNLRDYMSWRQVDCEDSFVPSQIKDADETTGHINNLYNTTFWSLVQLPPGMDAKAAEQLLSVSRLIPTIKLA